jgi:hypothetical protein
MLRLDASDFANTETKENSFLGIPIKVCNSMPENMIGIMSNTDFYLYEYNFETGISEIYHKKKGEYHGNFK